MLCTTGLEHIADLVVYMNNFSFSSYVRFRVVRLGQINFKARHHTRRPNLGLLFWCVFYVMVSLGVLVHVRIWCVIFITRTMLASMGISCRRVSICSSVWLSVTSRCSTETAKCRITQTVPYDSPGTLVFCCRKSWQNSNGVARNRGAKCKWGMLSAGVVAENWPLLTRFVANLVWSQIYQWASTLFICNTFAVMQWQLILCFFVTNRNYLFCVKWNVL